MENNAKDVVDTICPSGAKWQELRNVQAMQNIHAKNFPPQPFAHSQTTGYSAKWPRAFLCRNTGTCSNSVLLASHRYKADMNLYTA
jgi:hypothetical protein